MQRKVSSLSRVKIKKVERAERPIFNGKLPSSKNTLVAYCLVATIIVATVLVANVLYPKLGQYNLAYERSKYEK